MRDRNYLRRRLKTSTTQRASLSTTSRKSCRTRVQNTAQTPEETKTPTGGSDADRSRVTRGEKRPCPLFKVTTSHLDDKNSFKDIDNLFHPRVKIEDFARPKQPVQCMKCQRIWHTKNFFHLTANCVKYCGPHISAMQKSQRRRAKML
ncbi:hypothetical protein J437_LFUL005282 [Ladona fulva]|uniref:Uncharacterized protein n=1 Tax=Ladona fulva TaxID=123851 RepID=A0A8K0K2I3_LADFU|nr:hypothetical protein J437_LFUL005282 [Ladona fulva]